MSEQLPPARELSPEQEAMVAEHGGLDVLEERFGLGHQELFQEVRFGSHSGSLLSMLTDERCPVGEMVENAHQQGGTEAVHENLMNLKKMGAQFNEEQIFPEPRPESKKKVAEPESFETEPEVLTQPTLTSLSDVPELIEQEQAVRNWLQEPKPLKKQAVKQASAEIADVEPDISKTQEEQAVDDKQVRHLRLVEPEKEIISEAKPEPANDYLDIKVTFEEPETQETDSPEPSEVRDRPNQPLLRIVPPEPEHILIPSTEAFESEKIEAVQTLEPEAESQPLDNALEIRDQADEIKEPFMEFLPEQTKGRLADFIKTAPKEEIEAAENLINAISEVAVRYGELVLTENLETMEAQQIEQILEDWYEELLELTGIDYDEETIELFIAALKTQEVSNKTDKTEESWDEGTHERKFFNLNPAQLTDLNALRQQLLGRRVLELSK